MATELIFEHSASAAAITAAAAAALLTGAFGLWRYIRSERQAPVLALLRLAFVLVMAWCLFMPVLKKVFSESLKPRFIVALDVSASMSMTPTPGLTSRWDNALALLAQPWSGILAGQCEIDCYTLAGELGPRTQLAAIKDAKPAGASSCLKENIEKIFDRYKGQNVCGLLFLSDGLDTREATDEWASMPRGWPVYSARLEPENIWKTEPDVRVESVDTPRRIVAGWDSELKASVSGQGAQGKAVTVQLYENEKLLQEAPLQLSEEGGARPVTFRLEHPQTGSFTYTVKVPPIENERRTNDNTYSVSVLVTDAKNRLLYLEGVPRWESKYLVRELKGSKDITPVCFVRGPGGRFLGTGTKSTPAEETKPAQLANYKIVILGDLDGSELGEEQARAMADFVENGGSLVVLGGARAWGPSGLLSGPLAKILPVKSSSSLKLSEGSFPLAATAEGQAHQVLQSGDRKEWKNFPPVLSVFTGAELTPGAETLMATGDESGRHPVVVVHKYGQGKVSAILTDSLWRWQLAPGEDAAYRRFWTGLLFWLSPAEEDIKQWQVELFSDTQRIFIGEQIHLAARIGGLDKAPGAKESVVCEITSPDNRKVPFTMAREELTATGGKKFSGFGLNYAPQAPGLYRAAAVADVEGRKLSSEPYSFYVRPFTPESDPRPLNVAVLRAMATASGGKFCELSELNGVLSSLTIRETEEQKVTFTPLWNNIAFLACLMIFLTIEWVIRKLNNMA